MNASKKANKRFSYFRYRFSLKYFRGIVSRRKRRKKEKKSSSKKIKGSSKKTFLSRLVSKISVFAWLILAILAIIAIFGLHVREYYSITLTAFNEEEIQNSFEYPDYNVAFFIGEQTDEDSIFIKGITIISVNESDQNVKFIGVADDIIVSPRFAQSAYTLRTLYNQVPQEEGQQLLSYISIVEAVASIRIDRYMYVERSDLEFLNQKYNFSTNAANESVTQTSYFAENEKISKDEFTEYLLDTTNRTIAADNTTSFLREFLQKQVGVINSYFSFWKADTYFSNVKTDMSKGELFSWMDLLGDSRFDEVFVIGENVGFAGTTGVEDGIILNDIAAQESLEEYLRSLSILTEQSQIEVYNATGTPGLASSIQRRLEVYGINVVKIGNATEERVKSKIIVFSDDINPYENTLSIIEKSIQAQDIEIEYLSSDESGNYAGDIIILLGEDSI